MSKESKILIGAGAVVVVALIVAVAVSLTAGLVVCALGLIGAFVALRVSKPDTDDPFAEARSEADDQQVGNLSTDQTLAPWSPEGGLNAWTPPVSLTGLPDAPPLAPGAPIQAPEDEPAPEPTSTWSNEWSNDDSSWDSAYTAEAAPSTDTNPLDELQGLDNLDPIAEVERIEARSTEEPPAPTTEAPFSFGGVSAPTVNEDVAGADDIMAASQATELHLADGEQTELQKLLAKVQIRLSAYE